MYGYDGPSIDLDGELARQHANHQHAHSSAWSNMRFERVLIREFSPDGNLVDIELDDGSQFNDVRIQTPLALILMLYGEVDKLRNLTGTIYYRATPYDGFVLIGDLLPAKEEVGSRIINEPFYL